MTSDSGSRVFTMFRTGACVLGPQLTGWAESPEKRRYMTPTNAAITATAAAATRNNVGSPAYGPPLTFIQRDAGVTPPGGGRLGLHLQRVTVSEITERRRGRRGWRRGRKGVTE